MRAAQSLLLRRLRVRTALGGRHAFRGCLTLSHRVEATLLLTGLRGLLTRYAEGFVGSGCLLGDRNLRSGSQAPSTAIAVRILIDDSSVW